MRWFAPVYAILGAAFLCAVALMASSHQRAIRDPFAGLEPYITYRTTSVSPERLLEHKAYVNLRADQVKTLLEKNLGARLRWEDDYWTGPDVWIRPHYKIKDTFKWGEHALSGEDTYLVLPMGERQELTMIIEKKR